MNIRINGQQQNCRSCTLTELLAERALNPDYLVVELNHEILRREQWSGVRLKENDVLELLNFVGGG